MIEDRDPVEGELELTTAELGGGTALDAETMTPSYMKITSVEEGE